MPYKDKEKAAARSAEWQRTHPERRASSSAKWRKAHREEWNAYQRELYAAHREERRAQMRERYAARKEKILEKRQRLEEEMSELTLEKCPLCGNAGAVKIAGKGYAWGCAGRKCPAAVGKCLDALLEPTAQAAAAAWNGWASGERARLEREDGERPATPPPDAEAGEAPEETADEPPAPPAEEPAEEADPAEEEPEAAGGARLWLEVDGSWLWLDAEGEGCEGCAFRVGFGKRTVCMAASEEDLQIARTLCDEPGGVWREQRAAE